MERIVFTFTSRYSKHSLVGSSYPAMPLANTLAVAVDGFLLRVPTHYTGIHGLLHDMEVVVRTLNEYGGTVIDIEGSNAFVILSVDCGYYLWRVLDGYWEVRGRGQEFNNKLTETILEVLREEQA